MLPAVSVIIPCYNQGHYLSSALGSVLKQTFQHWEAIVVNDGSTDNTAAVASYFRDARIRCVAQDNRGLSEARNTGIRLARGRYLAFLDADDEWDPAFLSETVATLETHQDANVAGAYTECVHIDEEGRLLPQPGHPVAPSGQLYRRLLEAGFFPPHCVVVLTSVVKEVGMLDPGLPRPGCEDLDLWLRIAKRYRLIGVSKPLARYRVYRGTMSTKAAGMHASRVAVIEKHFASLGGSPQDWRSDRQKALSCAHFNGALGHMIESQRDRAWHLLTKAALMWPDLLDQLPAFYELACGSQPRGFRGTVHGLDLPANSADLLRRLEALVRRPELRFKRATAFGKAYLALAMLSDIAGEWAQAGRYYRRAFAQDPRLLFSSSTFRRFVRVSLGPRVAKTVHALRGREQALAQHDRS